MGYNETMTTFEELSALADTTTPKCLVSNLSFDDGLYLAKNFLNNEEWNEELQEFGVCLLEELSAKYPVE